MSRFAWTTELPTVPGVYWCAIKFSEHDGTVTAEMLRDYDGLWVERCDRFGVASLSVADFVAEQEDATVYWYGPLTPPALTPPGGGT